MAAKTMDEVRTRTGELQGQLLEVQSSLLTMQQSMAAMQDENIRLRRKHEDANYREGDLHRYEMTQFFETQGIVYRLKESEKRLGEPEHYACSTCYKKGEVSILQPQGVYLACKVCSALVQMKTRRPMSTRSTSTFF